ncbi:FG-GAP-like repeat-containing protein [Micromonospora parva]|uniref:FG-GAP-like repeat-containing protein n=1 Tax=Micromonospora parva TaxID=1464048 RepID=UPI001427A7DE|nr:FG-GAP-like repeat-containing protein [Micromonospora parva]
MRMLSQLRLLNRGVLALLTALLVLVASGTPAFAAALPPPAPVSAKLVSETQVEVSWPAVAGASSYEVRRGTVSGGPYTTVGTVTGTSYLDGTVAAETTYYYVVRSRSGKRASGDSSEVSVQTSLAKPVNVRATAAETSMTLRWKAVAGTARYEIVRLSNDAPVETVVGTTTSTEYVDTGLTVATRYVYWIRAVATGGATATSDAVRVYTGPATTTTVTVSPGSVEQGQRILLIANVRYADGRIPGGEVAFMSAAGAVAFATVNGTDGTAIAMVNGAGWTPTSVYAQFQGYDWPAAGASVSGDAVPVVTQPYGAVAFNGPSWLKLGSWEEAVAAGDLTGDGLSDVVITTTEYFDDANDHSAFLFVQEADNQLVMKQQVAMSTSSGGSMYPVIGDLDGDGANELVVATGDGVDVFRRTGSGLSAAEHLSFGDDLIDLRLRDLDGDGRTDIVAVSDNGVLVRYGDDNGSFAPAALVSAHRGFVLDVVDMTGDGRADLVVQLGQLIQISAQVQPRSFAAPVGYQAPAGHQQTVASMAVGDVTGDGRKDVVVTVSGNAPNAQVQVLTHDSAGVLGRWIRYPVYEMPDAIAIADVNNDGRDDVAITHGGWSAASVLLQRPDGWLGNEFRVSQLPPASSFTPRGLAVADINNDGLKDLLMANYNYGLVVVPQRPAATSAASPKVQVGRA